MEPVPPAGPPPVPPPSPLLVVVRWKGRPAWAGRGRVGREGRASQRGRRDVGEGERCGERGGGGAALMDEWSDSEGRRTRVGCSGRSFPPHTHQHTCGTPGRRCGRLCGMSASGCRTAAGRPEISGSRGLQAGEQRGREQQEGRQGEERCGGGRGRRQQRARWLAAAPLGSTNPFKEERKEGAGPPHRYPGPRTCSTPRRSARRRSGAAPVGEEGSAAQRAQGRRRRGGVWPAEALAPAIAFLLCPCWVHHARSPAVAPPVGQARCRQSGGGPGRGRAPTNTGNISTPMQGGHSGHSRHKAGTRRAQRAPC